MPKDTESKTCDLFSVLQAAQRMNCSERKVRQLLSDKLIGCHRIGRRVLISEQQILRFLQANETLPLEVNRLVRKCFS